MQSTFAKPVEYAFTTRAGETYFEICESVQDVWAFRKMHNAVKAAPVTNEENESNV